MFKVFVEVGSHSMPFDRLLKEVDSLAKKNSWKVFAQTGYSRYGPEHMEAKDFVSEKELLKKIRWADVVVAHGGAGNIITALGERKPLVIVPRRKRFGEHTDDHQTELAKVLEREGKCVSVREIRGLGKAIRKARGKRPKVSAEKKRMIKRIEKFIGAME